MMSLEERKALIAYRKQKAFDRIKEWWHAPIAV